MPSFSFEKADEANRGNLYFRLSHFFRSDTFPFTQKIVFSPGTAPMNDYSAEIHNLLYCTDFDIATLVDPRYAEPARLAMQLEEMAKLSESSSIPIRKK